MENLIIIILIWVILNAAFPLFLNSIERQYKENIDNIVRVVFWINKQIFVRILQFCLIILAFPNIVVGFIVQNKQFKNKKTEIFFSNYVMIKDGLLESNFPYTLAKGLKVWKERFTKNT